MSALTRSWCLIFSSDVSHALFVLSPFLDLCHWLITFLIHDLFEAVEKVCVAKKILILLEGRLSSNMYDRAHMINKQWICMVECCGTHATN